MKLDGITCLCGMPHIDLRNCTNKNTTHLGWGQTVSGSSLEATPCFESLNSLRLDRELALSAARIHLPKTSIDGLAVLGVSTSATEDGECCIRMMLGDASDNVHRNVYTLEMINQLLKSEQRSSSTEIATFCSKNDHFSLTKLTLFATGHIVDGWILVGLSPITFPILISRRLRLDLRGSSRNPLASVGTNSVIFSVVDRH